MPIFEIQGQDGKIYEVDAPDQASAVQAFTQFQPPKIVPNAPVIRPVPADAVVGEMGLAWNKDGGYDPETGELVVGGRPFTPGPSKLTSAAAGVTDTGLSGFFDEAYAKGKELFGAGTYDQNLADTRLKLAQIKEANPKSYMAGQVGGGLAQVATLGGAGLLPSAPAGSSLAARALVGAGEGGALGGLYGFGSGEGLQDRVNEAGFNAAIGGALGGLVPALASGGASIYRNVADRFAKERVARAAGVRPEVARMLADVTNADATLGPTGAANMARAGNEAMFADAGPNARKVLDYTIQKGGPGAVLARQRIDQRLGRDSAAMTSMLDQTLGTPEGILASQNAIRQAAKPGVKAAYEVAENTPINYATPEGMAVEDIINRIPGRFKSQAIQRANERLAYEGRPNLQIMADIADNGSVSFREMPNVMQADAIKKALDEIARDGTDIGGKMTAEAAFASRMARDLRDAVASAVPEYATALKTAADPLSRIAATEAGGSLLSDRVTRDQAAMMLDRMSGAEKTAARQGVRSFIDDQMARVKTAFTDPNIDAREAASAIKNLSRRANRDKLTTLLGEAEAKTLFDELDRVSQSFGLKASIAENSKTFAREATDEMVKSMTEPGAVGTLAQGKPVNAAQRVIQYLTDQTPEAIKGRQDAIISDVAEFLTRPSSQAVPQFKAVQDFGEKLYANDKTAKEISRLLSQFRGAVYPATAISND
jgi:hypothetical protein